LLDFIHSRFEAAFTTHNELSIDEVMIPFKSRLGLKQ